MEPYIQHELNDEKRKQIREVISGMIKTFQKEYEDNKDSKFLHFKDYILWKNK
jgi:hypothetical protein